MGLSTCRAQVGNYKLKSMFAGWDLMGYNGINRNVGCKIPLTLPRYHLLQINDLLYLGSGLK